MSAHPVQIWYNFAMPEPIGIRVPEAPRPTPETGSVGVEHRPEKLSSAAEKVPEVQPVDFVPPPNLTPAPVAIHPPADGLVKNIEGAMANGLEEAYSAMDPATQQRFKQTGEATAIPIEKLLQQSKIQVKKIVELLLRWLRIIPKVNPYYLEQQAKIKADAIVALKHPPRQGS